MLNRLENKSFPRAGKKVVVTGMGIVAPTGIGIDSLLNALKDGESASAHIENVNVADYPVKSACQVRNFNVTDFLNPKQAKHMERCSQFGVVAAKMAVEDAKLELSAIDQDRLEIYEGTSIGGMEKIFDDHQILLTKGYLKLHPFTPVRAFVGSTTGEIAIVLGINSKSLTICSGSSSASDAIGLGLERIKSGMIDFALVGGSETPIVPAIIASFCRMGVVSVRGDDPKAAFRPFSSDRDGFVLGEGSAFLVLESLESAVLRGASIYAEIAGYGASCDAYHMVMPHEKGEGVRVATRRALTMAGLTIDDIDYINAHGTGTLMNDKYETLAIKSTFGERASQIAISSTKPITGHLLGACGALEAAICILAIQHNFVPPTINYSSPDPDCDLNYAPNKAIQKQIDMALSYTYGFGGKNSALIFRKYSDAR